MSPNQDHSSLIGQEKEQQKPLIIILMGVSGSGKTTIGSRLAKQLNWPFYDADDFHSLENIAKMHHGVPLTDKNRYAWLRAIRQVIEKHMQIEKPTVIACSALKSSYRKLLKAEADERIEFVYLKGPPKLIRERLRERNNHFMKDTLLENQFDTLEPPEGGLTVDVSANIEQIVHRLASIFAD